MKRSRLRRLGMGYVVGPYSGYNKGPLRKILGFAGKDPDESQHRAPLVRLECGHIVRSNGAIRARCDWCKAAAPPAGGGQGNES